MKIKNTLILLLLLSVTLVACDGTPSSDWVTSEDGATSMPTTSNPFIEQPALYTLSFYTDGAGAIDDISAGWCNDYCTHRTI